MTIVALSISARHPSRKSKARDARRYAKKHEIGQDLFKKQPEHTLLKFISAEFDIRIIK